MELKLTELLQAHELAQRGCASCMADLQTHAAMQQALEKLKRCVMEYARATGQLGKENDARGVESE